jgi:hypothetical protein
VVIGLCIPFGLLCIALGFDEFYFHEKRGLRLWERVSHPFDTLTVLLCFSFLYFSEPTIANLKIYLGFAIFSCISITKDEFVHSEQCLPSEHWLHSVLFILHPITLGAAGFIWQKGLSTFTLGVQAGLAALFFIYQITRWPLKTVS